MSFQDVMKLRSRAEPPETPSYSGDDEIKTMLAEVDLLALIQADTGENGRKSGDRYDFKSCPICHHRDDFSYYPKTNSWSCFGASNSSGYEGGTALEYYKATRADDDTEAVKWLREQTGHPYQKKNSDKPADITDSDGHDTADNPPKHIGLVDAMINQGFVLVDGVPCVPGEHGFEFGWDAVHRAMLEFDSWSVDRTRNEATKTLRYQGREERAANHRYIAFNNCVLDIHTMKQVTNDEFARSGRGIIPVTIPHEYDPDAQPCEAVETLLEGISCGEREVRMNLEETIGLCLSRYTDDRSRAVWLYGRGQNGKSTYWQALSFVVGERNTCSLCLDDLKGQFNTQMLVGKLMCVSDDEISNSVSKAVIGTIKKIVTGQPIKVEPKGKNPYNATLFCTMIVTSNEPPQLADTTHGSLRRWHMIPLNADFSEGGNDINLSEKLHTEQAAQWLIKLGIDGLKRILANEGMTKTRYSLEAIKDARERSNSVYAFLADHPRREFLEDRNVETWYWRYQAEAKNGGSRPFEQAKFTQMVCDEYKFETANNGRYKSGEWHIGVNGIARDHGRKAGDKYRVFVEKEP